MSKKIITFPISLGETLGVTTFIDGAGEHLKREDIVVVVGEMQKKLSDTIAVLGRCNDAWQGGVEDHGLMDDISTLRNQIRKLIEPTPDAETIIL